MFREIIVIVRVSNCLGIFWPSLAIVQTPKMKNTKIQDQFIIIILICLTIQKYNSWSLRYRGIRVIGDFSIFFITIRWNVRSIDQLQYGYGITWLLFVLYSWESSVQQWRIIILVVSYHFGLSARFGFSLPDLSTLDLITGQNSEVRPTQKRNRFN